MEGLFLSLSLIQSFTPSLSLSLSLTLYFVALSLSLLIYVYCLSDFLTSDAHA